MLIKVKVFPCSKEAEIIKKSEDSFDVSVKEKPVMGLANKAVINLLSSFFKVSEKDVRLIKGFKERNKIFEIRS
jgi:hypothetical protein